YCQESPISLKNLTESADYNNSGDCDDDSCNAGLAKEIGASTMRASYVIGLTLLQMDACCIIYVIYRTFVRWRMAKRRLSMAYKLPFYMACFDFITYIFQSVNLVHPLLFIDNWPSPGCSIIAGGFFFGSVLSISFIGVSSLMSWLIVCKKIQIDFGAYDYKLLIWPFGFSTVLTAISAHTFGSDQF
ncbi:15548_t:CDS:2, partial [Cetraspora pellucida]